MPAGRPKGSTGHIGKQIAEMVSTALKDAGGADYLRRQADENPAAFMTLVGRLMPKDINIASQEDENGNPKSLLVEFIKSHANNSVT